MSDARRDDQGLEDSPADAAFRAEVAAWLADQSARGAAPRGSVAGWAGDGEANRAWQSRLVDAGLAAVAWPPEYGGRSGTARQQAIVDEELARRRLPPTGSLHRHGHGGPDDHGSRDRRAEAAVHPAHPAL